MPTTAKGTLFRGKLGDVLVPEDRYAKMNNVWFIPSADTLISWMKKMGFKNPRLVDVCPTTTEEQRMTEWMKFHSLKELSRQNRSKQQQQEQSLVVVVENNNNVERFL